jgi:cytochrome c oxidase subunit III
VGESAIATRVSGAEHGAGQEQSPFGVQSKKLAMWLFIMADAATFGAMLFAYGFLRLGSAEWTRPFAFFPSIVNGIAMTLILLTSSVTMLAAVAAAQGGRLTASVRWMWATAGLGALFALLHLREWFSMFHEGWSVSHNPEGGPVLFGATFFGITGLHLLHVTCGVIALAVVATMVRRGRLNPGHVETTGLYWHFVDLVWMFVFPLVYLMNAR